jgi:hypothetical protein
MGNTQPIQKINFEDVQYVLKNNDIYILINTLNTSEQECLILNTLRYEKEEEIINKFLKIGNKNVKIVVYGKNCSDEQIYKKFNQLTSLGFYNTYIYLGGLFEWLLLQDIYGDKEFPTTSKQIDILKYKPHKTLGVKLIEY